MRKTVAKIFTSPKAKFFWLLLFVLAVSSFLHAYNMTRFPYYENDEGTYISQAWSLIKYGTLSPYTYWYDHAPLGWFFLAAWAKLTGGFFTFGTSIDSGRFAMLFVHLVNSALVFSITKKITGKLWPAVLAVLAFSSSPLAIYFQRRVLLDNIMTMWVLVGAWILLRKDISLRAVISSFAILGIAVLTKENAVFFLPAYLYILWKGLHKDHKSMAIWLALASTFSVISTYVLYALLKSEFFPQTFFLGSKSSHVSLISTLKEQFSRGNKLPFWNTNSDFYLKYLEWIQKDPILVCFSLAAIAAGLLLAYRHKSIRIPLVFTVCFMFFLMRGGLIINFYFIPIMPFLAMLIATVANEFIVLLVSEWQKILPAQKFLSTNILKITATAFFFIPVISMPIANANGLFTEDQTTPTKQSVDWIKKNLSPENKIIVDNAIFVDVRDKKNNDEKEFPNAEWFWKVEKDKTVYEKNIGGDWKNVDYLILSHEMVKQIADFQIYITKDILTHSTLVKSWQGGHAFLDLPNFISTDGDWMSAYKVNTVPHIVLQDSWAKVKDECFSRYGQTTAKKLPTTTSQNQANYMLKAVLIGDRAKFKDIWSWTRDHLQHRQNDMLLSSVWENSKGDGKLLFYQSDPAANQDAAFALLLAFEKWGAPEYKEDAMALLDSIWKFQVMATKNGSLFLTSDFYATEEKNYIAANLSDLSFGEYETFYKFDPNHDWRKIGIDSKIFLNQFVLQHGLTPFTEPSLVLVNTETGNFSQKRLESTSAINRIGNMRLAYQIALNSYFERLNGTNTGTKLLSKSIQEVQPKDLDDKTFFALLSFQDLTDPEQMNKLKRFFEENLDSPSACQDNPYLWLGYELFSNFSVSYQEETKSAQDRQKYSLKEQLK